MKKKVVSLLLVIALSISVLAGCGNTADTNQSDDKGKESAEEVSKEADAEEVQEVDLSGLTFGYDEWPVEPTIDYTQSWAKRFDGMEFTRIVNTNGQEPPEGQTADDNTKVWGFESATGMSPSTMWSASGDAFTQKQNQAIASGEIPDMMSVSMNQYKMLVKSGLLADLTEELREGDHPTLQKLYEASGNVALDMLEMDGRIYGIPQVNAQFDGSPIVWIRKDWMEKLNVEEPKTIADLEKIAKIFMDADMDGNGKKDTYGIPVLANFSAAYGGDGNMCDIFLNVGGAAPGIWQEQEDGTIIYGSLMDGAKEALTLLNSWYEQGIIPSDFATWDGDALKQAVGDGKAGIVFSPWWGVWSALNNSINIDENAEWSAYLLPEQEGGEIRSAGNSPIGNIYVVSKDFEDPSAFVYAYDLWNASKMAFIGYEGYVETNNVYNPMQGSASPKAYVLLGKTFAEKIATGEITDVDEAREYYTSVAGVNQDVNVGRMFIAKEVYDAIEAGAEARKVAAEGLDAITSYQHYLQWIVGPGALAAGDPQAVSTVFQGTTESMEMYSSFLADLEMEAYVNMIMGKTDGKSISDYFDAFVESYLAQGGETITAEVAEAIGK